jgi:hypothetical protein
MLLSNFVVTEAQCCRRIIGFSAVAAQQLQLSPPTVETTHHSSTRISLPDILYSHTALHIVQCAECCFLRSIDSDVAATACFSHILKAELLSDNSSDSV